MLIPAAFAHDHLLEAAAVPAGIELRMRVGEHLESSEPFQIKETARYSRFSLVSSAGARDVSSALSADSDVVATVSLKPAETGTLLLALDSGPRDIELDAVKFDAYLAEEGLLDALAIRRRGPPVPGRERYRRYLKSIVAKGPASGAAATTAVGQDLEIVPTSDPLTAEGAWTFTVLFRSAALSGAEVLIARRDSHGALSTRSIRTDDRGQGTVALADGTWVVRMVHMLPSTEPGIDWQSWWGSLTFQRPRAASPVGAPG